VGEGVVGGGGGGGGAGRVNEDHSNSSLYEVPNCFSICYLYFCNVGIN